MESNIIKQVLGDNIEEVEEEKDEEEEGEDSEERRRRSKKKRSNGVVGKKNRGGVSGGVLGNVIIGRDHMEGEEEGERERLIRIGLITPFSKENNNNNKSSSAIHDEEKDGGKDNNIEEGQIIENEGLSLSLNHLLFFSSLSLSPLHSLSLYLLPII